MVQSGRLFPIVINILLWIPLLIFVVPVALICRLYKTLFDLLVTKVLKRNYRTPHFMDFAMCQGDSYTLPNANCAQVWVVSGKWIMAEEFASHFHRCFLEGNPEKYRNLYAHVVNYGTYAYYKHCSPEQLDLKWHIREYPISDFARNGTLESFSAVWMTKNTYERNRPAWQIAILHFGDPEKGTMETGIVAKFSHALLDGYSFVHMVEKLADNPAPYMVKDRNLTLMDKLKYTFEAPKDVISFYGDMAFSSNSQSPFKEAARVSSPVKTQQQDWFMSFVTVDLATVKMIRKATEVHFACLMMSAHFGALRRFMLETKKEEDLPEYLWIGSSLPWPRHPHSFTNHWTMGFVKGPVRLADPLQRLRLVEQSYKKYTLENELNIKGMFSITPIVRLMPTWLRRLALYYDFGLYNVSLFFASLMCSPKKHYLLGREVKNIYLPLECPDLMPTALYGVTCSHSGQLDLATSASNALLNSQEELDRLTKIYFIEELDAIAAMTGLNGSCNTAISSHGGGENKDAAGCRADSFPDKHQQLEITAHK